MRLPLLLAALSLTPSPTPQKPGDHQDRTPQRYLLLYHAGKAAQLGEYLTEDSVFEDPTAELVSAETKTVGRAAIVARLTKAFAAIRDLRFTPTVEFVSGRFVVSAGTTSYAGLDAKGERVRVALKVATVVEFSKDGRVIRHSDYGDYERLLAERKQRR